MTVAVGVGIEGVRGDAMAVVLVVDDDTSARILFKNYVKRIGLKCFEAADGGGALAVLNTARIDVILTDLEMPGMDGLELLVNLRTGPHKGIPCIAISGHPDKLQLAMDCGAFARLMKPVRFNQLEPVITHALELKRPKI